MLCKVKILMLIIHLLWINCRCASRITDRHNMYSIACCMCSDRRGGRRYNFLLSKCKDTYIFHAVTLGMPTHRCDGALHVLQVFWRRGDDAAGGGEVTQQAAGAPSGVCTGHRKPHDSGSSLRTVVVLSCAKYAPLWIARKCDRYLCSRLCA